MSEGSKDIDTVAEAIYNSTRLPLKWAAMKDHERKRYLAMAQAAIDALQITRETRSYEDHEVVAVMGGEGDMRYGGQTVRSLGWRTDMRLVSPWVRVEVAQ